MYHHIIMPENPILGQGFQTVTGQAAANFVVTPDSQKVKSTDQGACSLHMRCVSEINQIETAINGALSAASPQAGAVPSIGATIKAKFESSHTDSNMYAVVVLNQVTRTETLINPSMDQKAMAHLTNDELISLYNKFGDGYVHSITYGKNVVAILQISIDKTTSKKEIEENLKVDSPIVKLEESVQIARSKLHSIEITDKEIYASGGKKSWDFNTVEKLMSEIIQHMESDKSVPIGYETNPLSSLNNIEKSHNTHINSLKNVIAQKLDNLKSDFKICINKLSNIALDNNLGSIFIYREDVKDLKHQKLMNLKKIAADYYEALKKMETSLRENKQIPSEEYYNLYIRKIEEVKKWYEVNERDILDAINFALIHQIHLNQTDNHNINNYVDFTIKVPTPVKNSNKANCLFMQAKNNQVGTFDLEYKDNYGVVHHRVCSNLSAEGNYVPIEVEKLTHLRITKTANLPSNTVINVYAAEEQIGNYNFTSIQFKHAKKTATFEGGLSIDNLESENGDVDLAELDSLDEKLTLQENYLNNSESNYSQSSLVNAMGFSTRFTSKKSSIRKASRLEKPEDRENNENNTKLTTSL